MGIIKGILFIGIFLGCTYVGMIISNKYKNRVNDLKEFKSMLNIMNTKIRYTYEPIGEIAYSISKISQNSVSNIFKEICNQLKTKHISDAWNSAIDIYGNNFSKEDKTLIKSMGKMLGKTDVNGQLCEINQAEEFLKIQIEKAEKEKEKNEKLYKSLGMSIGLAIIIILI